MDSNTSLEEDTFADEADPVKVLTYLFKVKESLHVNLHFEHLN